MLDLRFEEMAQNPCELCYDSVGGFLYFINGDIYRMSTGDITLPPDPFIEAGDRNFYRLGFDPNTRTLVVSDVVDYMQRGYLYGYDSEATEIFSCRAGIIPGSFCFIDENHD
ncbi:MAG: hypothetical protein R2744_00675 [Bacteroidales bacterium]